MKQISSTQNAYIKELLKLQEKSRERKKKGLFLAAVSLSFIHPFSHIQMDVKIDTPRKFLKRMEIETKQFMKYRSSS